MLMCQAAIFVCLNKNFYWYYIIGRRCFILKALIQTPLRWMWCPVNCLLIGGYFLFNFSDVAVEREVEGDLFLHDVGQGLCFKPGTFDGCIRFGHSLWFIAMSPLINPLHPNISVHILHTVLCTLTKELTRRICLNIVNFFNWWSFPLFLLHFVWFMSDILRWNWMLVTLRC